MFTWSQVVIAVLGAAIAVAVWHLIDFVRLKRLASYINMDGLEFQQLLNTGRSWNLAMALSRKLSEKGILLAWKSQRDLTALRDTCERDGHPVAPEDFQTLIGSLEIYRQTAGMMLDRIAGVSWYPGHQFDRSVPKVIRTTLDCVDRDWREFKSWSDYLQSFVRHHAVSRTE